MIFDAEKFVFEPPPVVSRARRILIKPCAHFTELYPMTTSTELLANIVKGIRRVSDADIIIIDGTPDGSSIVPFYRALGYNFPRALLLDVNDCILVEVENPLPKPLVVSSFTLPNVIIASDYLISVAPLKVEKGLASMSLVNLLSLLPARHYGDGSHGGWESLYELGIEQVIADLYFTLPFDMGIVEARQKLIVPSNGSQPQVEEVGKIALDEPFEADREIASVAGLDAPYLDIISEARVDLAF